jgi:hypothetical protein
MGRQRRRSKQLLDVLKEIRGYWKLKEEALDRTPLRTRFGWGYGPVLRQTMERTNERTNGHITINCTNRNLHLQKQWIYVYTVKLHDGLKRAETCCLRNSVLCCSAIKLCPTDRFTCLMVWKLKVIYTFSLTTGSSVPHRGSVCSSICTWSERNAFRGPKLD